MENTGLPDRNFDDLALKFEKKVYGGIKGKIRLAVLNKDLSEYMPKAVRPANGMNSSLQILDAGGGTAPFSLKLAQNGHLITLCDISLEMLKKAREKIRQHRLEKQVQVLHKAIQELDDKKQFDLILCHAVIDWTDDPRRLIACLVDLLKEGGILSLTFYNINGMIFKNLLRTNYKKILKKEYSGWPGSLTPTHPREPAAVAAWLRDHDLAILCQSGIRVFHDFILNPDDRNRHPETVLDLELKFSRKPPFSDLGRYQHILAQKTPGAKK